MAINPDQITAIIEKQIASYRGDLEVKNVGTVVEVGDGVATIFGLEEAMAGELVRFGSGVFGMVMNLAEDQVGVVVLGPEDAVIEGDEVRTTGRVVEVPVGEKLLGRVVNALGEPLDGKGKIAAAGTNPVERLPRGGGPAAGQGASPDRTQGRGLHGPDRAGPAGADHRRPPDRQDRDRA